MRYCTNCHNLTAGTPLFCGTCGGTYDVRLCPRLHPNPRFAQVCSECGSRDLSEPQPQVPLLTRWFEIGSRVWVFVVLFLVSMAIAVAFVNVATNDVALQGQLLTVLLFVGLLWWGFMQLPSVIRSGAGRMFGRRKRNGRGRH